MHIAIEDILTSQGRILTFVLTKFKGLKTSYVDTTTFWTFHLHPAEPTGRFMELNPLQKQIKLCLHAYGFVLDVC